MKQMPRKTTKVQCFRFLHRVMKPVECRIRHDFLSRRYHLGMNSSDVTIKHFVSVSHKCKKTDSYTNNFDSELTIQTHYFSLRFIITSCQELGVYMINLFFFPTCSGLQNLRHFICFEGLARLANIVRHQ